uniref:RING-type E3 ubiquitin transferase n=2 Tax=Photinus pyralis TaxID=7054 RepID=A0A1Y1LJA2_PHOPY
MDRGQSNNATETSDLNDTLTSLPIYSCRICNNFLYPPIRLVSKTGQVCGTCKIPDGTVAIHDTALETILWNLIFPCPNATKGCKERLVYYDVATHILTCLHRDYQCPFSFVTDCIWQGGRSDILEHANVQHPEGVISA